ncbi:hypothetical protein [Thioalkalivibrio thiocyanodenitrificans]|uniref:hypothetical protein n=1 Tax=Thioalkalivibrio thiocyanodenitrificans TaxID=243063 RepID=UPI000373B854|nr:hypothetical protein [Thioalkalivibrio thiocyanodenitrificans]
MDKKIRLTPKQKQFMDSIYEPGYTTGYFECHREEGRTARSLNKKGLVEFQGNDGPDNGFEYFTARLTEKARQMYCASHVPGRRDEDSPPREDFMKLHEIAQRLDAANPTLPHAFTGTVSERIERQLRARGIPGFSEGSGLGNEAAAIQLLRDHSSWLAENWNLSPEGREYRARFDAAVSVLDRSVPERKGD